MKIFDDIFYKNTSTNAVSRHVLVVTSTFPASDADQIPSFIRDQVVTLKKEYPHLFFSILAPHDFQLHAQSYTKHSHYVEYRFHYAFPRLLEKFSRYGIMPTIKKNPLFFLIVPFFVLAEFITLLKLTKKLKPDLIYAHWFIPQGIVAGMVSSLTQTPFVFTSHSSDVSVMHKLPIIGSYLVRYFTNRARAITVVSSRSHKKIRSFFNDSAWKKLHKKIFTVPMGVSMYNTEKHNQTTARQQKNILFIGRLVEKKGIHYLLSAFADVVKKHPESTLTVAGDGPWRTKLQHQVHKLGLSNKQVHFIGYVQGNIKQQVAAAADMCVVPSIITSEGDAEGLPVALLEGLAAGKICIATYESGADDIMKHKVNGFLVPQKNSAALATAIKEAMQLDEKERLALQHRARQLAKQFSWKNIAQQYYTHFFKAL